MHTYRQTDLSALWTVGFETPDEFRSIKDFDTEEKAGLYASFLNGGAVPYWFKWHQRGLGRS